MKRFTLTGLLLVAIALIPGFVLAQDRGVDLLGAAISPPAVNVGGTVEVAFTILNRGQRAMLSTGPEQGYTYTQGSNYTIAGFPPVLGAFRVGVNVLENPLASTPYRWGLTQTLRPGQTAVVTGKIKFETPGTYHLIPALEYSGRILKTGLSPMVVDVLPKGVKPKPSNLSEDQLSFTESPEPVAEASPSAMAAQPPVNIYVMPQEQQSVPYYYTGWRHVHVIYGYESTDIYFPGYVNPFGPTSQVIPVPMNGRILPPGALWPNLIALAQLASADETTLVVTP